MTPVPGAEPRPTLRHRFEAAAVAVIAGLFGALPVAAASALGGFIGRHLGPLLPPSRRASRNLDLVMPELSARERRRIVADMWDNLGRVIAEYPHLESLAKPPGSERISVVGADHLFAAVEAGRTVLLVGGHLANWEIGTVVAKIHDVALTSVYRAPDNPLVGKRLMAIRGGLDGELIPKGPAGARRLIAAVKRGAVIVMLMDQKLNDGIAAPFFGRPAMTAPAAAEFALRYDVVLVPTRIERLDGARFRVTLLPPVAPERTGDRQRDVLSLTTRLNKILEGWIRDRPGQWFWLHRRWPDS